ncbi:DUF2330 domain-containing protein [Chloroflexota bacterium]
MSSRATAIKKWGLILSGALLCACFLLPSFHPLVLADSGIIPVASVSVYEPGQKAIIGWNGEYEVLILSTDVSADDYTIALQILPLPSEPESIEQGTFDSFRRIANLIYDRYSYRNSWFECRTFEGAGGVGVDIVFHEKIGAHDIWVAKATDAAEFVHWAEDFLARNQIQYQISSPELESVVTEYIAEGIEFFVFDLIEISPEIESIEPIVYRFKSDALYYPLKISSIVSGWTGITLFLLTPWLLTDFSQLPKGEFKGEEYGLTICKANDRPIQFGLARGELESIDHRLSELLPGNAWLSAIVSYYRYGPSYGIEAEALPVASLDKDMKIAEGCFTEKAYTKSGFPLWAWVLIGISGAILAYIVVGLLYVFYRA